LNQFYSVLSFLFLIFVFSKGAFGQASEQKINDTELNSLLMTLAVDDDELKAETITSLAKSGDPNLEKFFELYRQGSVYNWPDQDGGVRIVVNEETVMDDDFNEFAPLFEPISGKPFLWMANRQSLIFWIWKI
jgi:hypothetical protein